MKTTFFSKRKSQDFKKSELLEMGVDELKSVNGGGGNWFMVRDPDGTIAFVYRIV